MNSLDGVRIQRGQVGANTLTQVDSVSGLICAAEAPSGLAHGDVAVIFNMKEVESLGITLDYDQENNVNVYRHISEFYRMASEGTKLFLMVVDRTTTLVEICEDSNSTLAKKLITEAEGEIRQLGLSVNPTGPTTLLNGVPDDVFNSIEKAQELYAWADNLFMPCNILLEGYDYGGDAVTTINLRAIPDVSAPKVSVVIGQDYSYAQTLTNNAQKFADIGTAIGTVASCAVNENMGNNELFNLTDSVRKSWLVPGLSNHTKNKDQIEDLQILEDKGFIFGVTYSSLSGVRWNDDHTCVEIIQDAEGNINEHTIAYGRTHDKARRVLRSELLKKIKTSQPVNPKTGKLPPGVVKYFENLGDQVFKDMEAAKEISTGKTTVDPNSDLLVAKLLSVGYEIVPYGNVGKILGTSNLKTSI